MRRFFQKTILIISLILVTASADAVTRRALVIGIGSYPATSGWAAINGDKDIPYVEEMLLLNGFQKKDIVELKNEQATYAAICRQMETLIAQSQTGDFVYIHFSGHGQQVSDLNGDEDEGYDESWIPYDAQFAYQKGVYEGGNHILDDQLNTWLHSLREKIGANGKIVVVADACHSGDGTRSAEEEKKSHVVIRGTSDTFVIPSSVRRTTGGNLYPVEWVSISACKPYQCNFEYKGMGSLTYALYQERQVFSGITCGELHQRIRTHIQQVVPQTQTPVLDTQDKQSVIF